MSITNRFLGAPRLPMARTGAAELKAKSNSGTARAVETVLAARPENGRLPASAVATTAPRIPLSQKLVSGSRNALAQQMTNGFVSGGKNFQTGNFTQGAEAPLSTGNLAHRRQLLGSTHVAQSEAGAVQATTGAWVSGEAHASARDGVAAASVQGDLSVGLEVQAAGQKEIARGLGVSGNAKAFGGARAASQLGGQASLTGVNVGGALSAHVGVQAEGGMAVQTEKGAISNTLGLSKRFDHITAGAGAHGSAHAGASATAQGSAGLSFFDRDSGKVDLDGGVMARGRAFVGAEANGSVQGAFGGVDATAKGAALAGIGAEGNVEMGFKDGKVRVALDLGLALGIGAKVGFDVKVDLKDAAKTALHFATRGLL